MKISRKPVAAPRAKAAAYGTGNAREAYAPQPPTNRYTTLHNEVPNREYLNSTAINESFELEALRRIDHELFHSLSCLGNKDGQ